MKAKPRSSLRHVVAAAVLCVAPLAGATSSQAADAPKPTAPPHGPGSLAGVWSHPSFKTYRTGPPIGVETLPDAGGNLETADGQPIPFQPWAREYVDARRQRDKEGKPDAGRASLCLPPGMPSMMLPPPQLPIQIVENRDQVTVLFENYGNFRIIHLNKKHADDPDPTFMGDSIGHWEGDTLVADTIAINPTTQLAGVAHSDQLHLVERFRRTGPDTLEDRMTLDDPKTYTRPWTWVVRLKHVPGVRIMEYVCEDERNFVGTSGETAVNLKSGN